MQGAKFKGVFTEDRNKVLGDIVNKINENARLIESWGSVIDGERAKTGWKAAEKWRDVQSNGTFLSIFRCPIHNYAPIEATFDRILKWLDNGACSEIIVHNEKLRDHLRRPFADIRISETRSSVDGSCEWILSHPVYSNWEGGTQADSVLWLHTNPGTGKSTLCCYVIDSIQKYRPEAAVAYYFYRFDQSHEVTDILRALAWQLFSVYQRVREGRGATSDVQRLIRMARDNECSLSAMEELFKLLVTALPRTYIFLDGLDEKLSDSRKADLTKLLSFLVSVSVGSPGTVRMWCSSQTHPELSKLLSKHTRLDVEEQMRSVVTEYLQEAIGELHDIPQELKDHILHRMQKRGEGNILWASLVMKEVQGAQSQADMRSIIEQSSSVDEYYQMFFTRVGKRDRELAW